VQMSVAPECVKMTVAHTRHNVLSAGVWQRCLYCFAVMLCLMAQARAEERLSFDIPSQPLAVALDQYAVVTGVPALFSSLAVDNVRSAPVTGIYTAKDALQRLLTGTGLVFEIVRSGPVEAFVLKAAVADDDHGVDRYAMLGFDGMVQQSIWQALCANAVTAPGDYRLLMQFTIGQQGMVEQVRIVSTSGHTKRDAFIVQAMQQVRIDRPVPAGLGQPLTMLILPRGQIAGQQCQNGATSHVR
jgi:hypothetical protein